MKKISAAVIVSLGLAGSAQATTELPGMYDGRSVAMGGTGVAFIENATSTFNNPATLDGIDKLSVTVDFSPFLPTSTAKSGAMDLESKGEMFPLFFAGAAYRISEPLVVGLAVYPTMGVGSTYEDVPFGPTQSFDMSQSIASAELAIPISYRLSEGLSVALSWRASYVMQTADMTSFDPATMSFVSTESDLSGLNLLGVQAGVYYRNPAVRLGFSYRSKVTTELEGKTNVVGLGEFDSSSEFATPHMFRLGAALPLLENKLLVGLDLKYLMYAEANEKLETVVTTPMGDQTTTVELDWGNVLSANLGVEYLATEMFAVRAGYSYQNSATPDSTANMFVVPPGSLMSFSVGGGMKLESFDVDLGIEYGFGAKEVEQEGATTEYGLTAYLVALSATYHY